MFDISFFQQHIIIYLICVGILGLIVGSFLNVVIYRLPIIMQREWRQQCVELLQLPEDAANMSTLDAFKHLSLSFPRSHCPQCKQIIKFFHNIPLFSYLALRGKCAYCGYKISFQYPFVELLCAILSMLIAWSFGVAWETVGALLFVWFLISLSAIDLEHQLLPDNMTLSLLWLGLLFNLFGLYTNLSGAVIGALAGYLFLWLVNQLFKLVTGKEGMGYGDFKLLAALGAWLGWQMLPLIVLFSSFIGAIVGIIFLFIKGQKRDTPIPYGPFLAIAGFIAMLWGNDLLRYYFAYLSVTS